MNSTELFDPIARAALIDALGVGVAVIDPQGVQIYANRAFADMVGWPAEALIGAASPFVYWPEEERDRIAEAMRRTLAGAAPRNGFELTFQRSDGERFDALLAISPVDLPDGTTAWVAATTDISKQKSAERGQLDREQRLDLAMSAGRLGSWEYQVGTGRVIWSPTLERIHGLEPGTFGGTFEDYQRDIHPEDLERVLGTIAQSSHGDIPHHLEYRIVRPDGEVRWLDASGQLFRGADGQPARMLGVCMDVTERKAAEEVARAAREEAERANRTKAEFLARMSHELRTPLNAIGGYLDLLDLGIHGPVTDAQRSAYASIKRNQDHLLVLINDLLHFAQLDAGKLSYDLQPVAAAPFLESMRPLLAPLADARGLGFLIDPVPDGARLQVDEDRLQQILLNLVGNAAKFTPPGGTVRISCEPAGETVRLAVRDTGQGIAADKLEAIFDPFVQLDRQVPGGERGVGLGLAISRELARAMGGDLTVESAPGEGSTFTVELPSA